ncbi:MAG TPA: UDP-glucose 4-epimerase GalE [Labilithrix sp.]|nr:UDP-glucose 4-epimerase GalE [Labilithrix sp.]
MAVLVTGGAGFVGSHMVACLREKGREVVVVDDLSAGCRDDVPADVPFVVADVADENAVALAIERHHVEAIIHFAGRIQVGESVTDPKRYWHDNVGGTIRLLESALAANVRTFLFSSTAAVYGTPERVPIVESAPKHPINPYGETKLAVERMLASYSHAYGLRAVALRYFNAAGADAELGLGERHEPETHLIPLVLDVALGKRNAITVFGRDYPTPDGTCIRDYIHVKDLADAHFAALEYLEKGGESGAFNLGTGVGHSVEEVIARCREVTGRSISVSDGPRRAGDPPSLVASPRLAEERLGWRATRSSLERIVADAWAARQQKPRSRDRLSAPVVPSARRLDEESANVR